MGIFVKMRKQSVQNLINFYQTVKTELTNQFFLLKIANKFDKKIQKITPLI